MPEITLDYVFGDDNVEKCTWMDKILVKKVWQMIGLTKRLSIVTVNFDGFSLANC